MGESSFVLLAARMGALVLAVMASAAHATYWNLFNFEGESAVSAQYATYSSLNDMLNDTDRLGVFDPTGGFSGQNIVAVFSLARASRR